VIRDSERLRTVTKMSEREARIFWENNHFKILHDTMICNYCGKIFSKELQRVCLTKHLFDEHQISELTNQPNSELIKNNFIIIFEKERGECKTCGDFISYGTRGMYLLENHYEMFHSNNVDVFDTALKAQISEDIFNHFILLESKKAICKFCEVHTNIEYLDVLTADILIKLSKHTFSHDRYEDNFLIFVKTIENRFCFTFFFQ